MTTLRLHGLFFFCIFGVVGCADDGTGRFPGSGGSSLPAQGWDLSLRNPRAPLRAIHAIAADDVWAAGDAGYLVHWNGIRWTEIESGTRHPLTAVFGTATDRVFTTATVVSGFSDPVFLSWDGNDWSGLLNRDAVGWGRLDLIGGMPSGVDSQWLVQRGTGEAPSYVLERRATGELSRVLQVRADAIWGGGPRDVWITAGAGFYHYSGSSWGLPIDAPSDQTLLGLGGSGNDNVFAVGELGVVHRYDGTAWSTVRDASAGAPTLRGVWTDARELWLVGDGGTILGSTSEGFESPDLPDSAGTGTWSAVTGVGDDLWVVGDVGILRAERVDVID